MKIALVSEDGVGAWFLLRLLREGNSCDYYLTKDDASKRVLRGMIPEPILRPPKTWAQYDLVIFDKTFDGDLADEIRKKVPVIGCSTLACSLENDRLFGMEAMEAAGIDVPRYEVFDSPEKARTWLAKNPDRYVYKPSQPEGAEELDCSTTYVAHSADDMARALDRLFRESKGSRFLLQKFTEGIECSTEAWFDGTNFHFINADIEEKKFLAGGLGPNVGCSGNLVWPYRNVPMIFSRGLGRMRDWLKEREYRGVIDLNAIVTRQHVWGLEWTPRFGYASTPTLLSLLKTPWAEFFLQFAAAPDGGIVVEAELDFEFGASIDISVPPYPESNAKADRNLPIDGISPDDVWRDCWLCDAMDGNGELKTAGIDGHIGHVLGRAHTPRGAWQDALDMVKKVKAPDLQWRNDLEQSTGVRYRQLQGMGWL